MLGAIALFYGLLHLIGIQLTPFFLYAMYSDKHISQDNYVAYELEVNDRVYLPYAFGRERMEMVLGPLDYYLAHKANNDQDPQKVFLLGKKPNWENSSVFNAIGQQVFTPRASLETFPDWYKRYMSHVMNAEIHSLKVYAVSYTYPETGMARGASALVFNLDDR